jgi:hypothetical protein
MVLYRYNSVCLEFYFHQVEKLEIILQMVFSVVDPVFASLGMASHIFLDHGGCLYFPFLCHPVEQSHPP